MNTWKNGRMDGWMNDGTDGGMLGLLAVWIDGWMDGWMIDSSGWTGVDEWMDTWKDRWIDWKNSLTQKISMDEQTRIDRWLDVQMHWLKDGCMNKDVQRDR